MEVDLAEEADPSEEAPLTCHGCNKIMSTKGAFSTHVKTCVALRPTCTTCLKSFKDEAALHGHHSRGACQVVAESSHPRIPTAAKERARLATHMEGPGDDVHSISACWVAIEENSDKPKEDNKSIFSKINSFELMNDRQAYGEFIAETVPGRGATAEVSHKTIASHVSF